MAGLKQAIAAGWNNAAQMEADHDVDGLRNGADFRARLDELNSGKQTSPNHAAFARFSR
jgi:hypothetical protein